MFNNLKRKVLILGGALLFTVSSFGVVVTFAPSIKTGAAVADGGNKVQVDFGVVSTGGHANNDTFVLDTADTVTATQAGNHFGGEASGSNDFTSAVSTEITALLEFTTPPTDNTNFVFTLPRCKIGAGSEAACSSLLAGTSDGSGTTVIKVGATLSLPNGATVPVADTSLDASVWTLTVDYT